MGKKRDDGQEGKKSLTKDSMRIDHVFVFVSSKHAQKVLARRHAKEQSNTGYTEKSPMREEACTFLHHPDTDKFDSDDRPDNILHKKIQSVSRGMREKNLFIKCQLFQ